jgi:hypothetical protein
MLVIFGFVLIMYHCTAGSESMHAVAPNFHSHLSDTVSPDIESWGARHKHNNGLLWADIMCRWLMWSGWWLLLMTITLMNVLIYKICKNGILIQLLYLWILCTVLFFFFKYALKFCDDGTLVQILRFWTLSIVLSLFNTSLCFSFKTHRFGNWNLSPSSGKPTDCVFCPIDTDRTPMSRLYLKTGTESSFRKVVFWKRNRTMY